MNEQTYTGTIAEKGQKATYWQIKLDIGNSRIVTLNTKDEGFWQSQQVGSTETFAYRESEIPGTRGDDGQPFKMKWIVLNNQSPKPAEPAQEAPKSSGQIEESLKEIHNKLDMILASLPVENTGAF